MENKIVAIRQFKTTGIDNIKYKTILIVRIINGDFIFQIERISFQPNNKFIINNPMAIRKFSTHSLILELMCFREESTLNIYSFINQFIPAE